MMDRWKEGLRAVGRSVFVLTPDERKIVCLILALALIGLCAKAWHRHRLDAQHEVSGVEKRNSGANKY